MLQETKEELARVRNAEPVNTLVRTQSLPNEPTRVHDVNIQGSDEQVKALTKELSISKAAIEKMRMSFAELSDALKTKGKMLQKTKEELARVRHISRVRNAEPVSTLSLKLMHSSLMLMKRSIARWQGDQLRLLVLDWRAAQVVEQNKNQLSQLEELESQVAHLKAELGIISKKNADLSTIEVRNMCMPQDELMQSSL